MTLIRRSLAALAAALFIGGPALAATPQQLSSTWAKIASAGSCVTVFTDDSSGRTEITTSGTIPSVSDRGRVLQFVSPFTGYLSYDLYARGPAPSSIAVDAGLCGGGGGSGGGGGGGGTAIQGQANDGTSPWNVRFPVPPVVYLNGSAANSSSNPLFASITNLPGTQPVSGTVGVNNFPSTQTVSGSVGISGSLPAFVAPPNVLVGLYSSTLPTLSSGTSAAVAVDVNGKQLIQGGNSIAVKTDSSATTQPVSGTVTANIGSLGSAASASLQSATQGAVAPGTAATTSTLGGQVYNSTPPAPTSGQQVALQSDAAGNLKVNNATLPPGAALDASVQATTAAITSAAYPAGTAGSPSPQVLTVQPPSSGGTTFPTAPQSAAPNVAGTGSISAANGYVSIATGTLPTLGLQISGTFVATLVATCSNDNDATSPVGKSFLIPGSAASTSPSVPSISAPGNFAVLPGACDHIRITASSWTSGTITVTWMQTGATFDNRVSAPIAAPLPGTEVGSQNPAAGIVPVTSTATGTAASNGVIGKATPGNLYDTTALNTSATLGYLVALNLAALPASGAAIAPLDFRPLYPAANGNPGFAEIDAKPGISCTVGCVVVISASLTTYTPTPTGILAARAR